VGQLDRFLYYGQVAIRLKRPGRNEADLRGLRSRGPLGASSTPNGVTVQNVSPSLGVSGRPRMGSSVEFAQPEWPGKWTRD